MSSIDLTGKAGRGEGGLGGSGSPRGSGPSITGEAARRKLEDEFKGELERTFGRIADLRAARGDEELATILEEDKRVLSEGLSSLTSAVVPLRKPLKLVVHLLEPLLAFGRVASVLVGRVRQRFYVEEEPDAPTA